MKSLLLVSSVVALAAAMSCKADPVSWIFDDDVGSDATNSPPADVAPQDKPAPTPAPVPDYPGDFTLVLLPDTQKYSEAYPEIFEAQTRWVVENRDAERIAYVLHEGDITDNNIRPEWRAAKAAIELMDGQLYYTLAVGNHDMGFGGEADIRDTAFFNETFRLQDYVW